MTSHPGFLTHSVSPLGGSGQPAEPGTDLLRLADSLCLLQHYLNYPGARACSY